MSTDDTERRTAKTNKEYARWVKDTITNDTHGHYYSFIIQSISKPEEPRDPRDPRDIFDRDQWIRRGVIRASEATTSSHHNRANHHLRRVSATDACGVIMLPAKTKTARTQQLHGWLRIPHSFLAKDGLGNVATALIEVRVKRTKMLLAVPTPIGIFHHHIKRELNSTNIWWHPQRCGNIHLCPQPEHLPDPETGQTFAGLAYALRPKKGETRVWSDVEFQPAYLFGHLLSLHKAA